MWKFEYVMQQDQKKVDFDTRKIDKLKGIFTD
jgi:hypothetical protein